MAKDQINPSHYKQYPMETIDMMVAIWGVEKTIDYCIMTAFKYRMRAGHKDDVEQELAKEKWYLDKAKWLKTNGFSLDEIVRDPELWHDGLAGGGIYE